MGARLNINHEIIKISRWKIKSSGIFSWLLIYPQIFWTLGILSIIYIHSTMLLLTIKRLLYDTFGKRRGHGMDQLSKVSFCYITLRRHKSADRSHDVFCTLLTLLKCIGRCIILKYKHQVFNCYNLGAPLSIRYPRAKVSTSVQIRQKDPLT